MPADLFNSDNATSPAQPLARCEEERLEKKKPLSRAITDGWKTYLALTDRSSKMGATALRAGQNDTEFWLAECKALNSGASAIVDLIDGVERALDRIEMAHIMRERCAKIAETCSVKGDDWRKAIAAAIREGDMS